MLTPTCWIPHLLDDVQAIDRELGREPHDNWNQFDRLMASLLKQRGSKWKKPERKAFRDVFADVELDAKIEPVILKQRQASGDPHACVWGWFPARKKTIERMYEPNTQLRDYENVQLAVNKEKDRRNERAVIRHFKEQVQPHLDDSWADRDKIRSAYEINFNRYFYEYNPPRPLAEIDADIKRMEAETILLLREVTG